MGTMKPGMYLQKWSSNDKCPFIEVESDVIAILENGSKIKVSVSRDGTELLVWHKNPHTGQLAAMSACAVNTLRLTVVDDNKKTKKLEAELAKNQAILKELKELADRARGDF